MLPLRSVRKHGGAAGNIVALNCCLSQLSSNKSNASSQLAENLDYCTKIVEERDYENFVATLLMPKSVQPSIISMLALNAEVSAVRQKIKRNSGVAGIYQLQFWRDALRVWAGQQKGILPRQPAIACLKAYGDSNAEDISLMLRLVEARQATLGDRPFETLADLEENSTKIFGSIIRLWANTLIRNSRASDNAPNNLTETRDAEVFGEVADKIAKAVGIATLLRSTLPLLKEGIVLLPVELMNTHGLNPDLIFNNRKPDLLKRMVGDLCQVSFDHLASAREGHARLNASLRAALMASAFRAEFLTGILRKNNHDIFATRLQHKHPFTSWKLWWRYRRKTF